MAYDIITTKDGHFAFTSDGDLLVKNDAERVAQQVANRLSMIKGRYPFDIIMGVPLLSEDGQGNPQSIYLSDKRMRDSTRRAIIAAVASEVPDVISVDSILMRTDTVTRHMTIDIMMTTNKGLVKATVKP